MKNTAEEYGLNVHRNFHKLIENTVTMNKSRTTTLVISNFVILIDNIKTEKINFGKVFAGIDPDRGTYLFNEITEGNMPEFEAEELVMISDYISAEHDPMPIEKFAEKAVGFYEHSFTNDINILNSDELIDYHLGCRIIGHIPQWHDEDIPEKSGE